MILISNDVLSRLNSHRILSYIARGRWTTVSRNAWTISVNVGQLLYKGVCTFFSSVFFVHGQKEARACLYGERFVYTSVCIECLRHSLVSFVNLFILQVATFALWNFYALVKLVSIRGFIVKNKLLWLRKKIVEFLLSMRYTEKWNSRDNDEWPRGGLAHIVN